MAIERVRLVLKRPERVRLLAPPSPPKPVRVVLDRRRAFVWSNSFEKWSQTWARKNYWRVAALVGSEEDALQECALVFARVVNKYAATVDNPAWMMALYKVAIVNKFNDMARDNQKLKALYCSSGLSEGEQTPAESGIVVACDYNLGPLSALLNSASESLRAVMVVIAEAPPEFLHMIFQELEGAPQHDARVENRLRRLCNLPAGVTPLAELRALLRNPL